MASGLPPPPVNDSPGSFSWMEWYRQLRNYVSTSGSVPWYIINFAGSNITDIATRDHNQMQDLQGGTSGEMYHLTSSQITDLTVGAYGSMYMTGGAVSVTITSAGTYYKIASGYTTGLVNQFTFQNTSELLCNKAGKYKIDWSMSINCATASQLLASQLFKNGVGVTGTTMRCLAGTASGNVELSGTTIQTLALNDVLSLAVSNLTAANPVIISDVNISVTKVGS
jgi:hypothetical protein